jgi:hypothetical protein
MCCTRVRKKTGFHFKFWVIEIFAFLILTVRLHHFIAFAQSGVGLSVTISSAPTYEFMQLYPGSKVKNAKKHIQNAFRDHVTTHLKHHPSPTLVHSLPIQRSLVAALEPGTYFFKLNWFLRGELKMNGRKVHSIDYFEHFTQAMMKNCLSLLLLSLLLLFVNREFWFSCIVQVPMSKSVL